MSRKNNKGGKVLSLPNGGKRTALEDGGFIDFIPDDPKSRSSLKGRYEITRGYRETAEARLNRIHNSQRANRYDPSKEKKTRRASKRDAIKSSMSEE